MIEKLTAETAAIAAKLAHQLWPEVTKPELTKDFTDILNNDDWICLLYKPDEIKYAGFILMSLRRDYVEGSDTSPVAYIEGIYVAEPFRRNHIAQQLVAAGAAWGKQKGCTEMGSDCEQENAASIAFHTGAGFQEVSRLVCFLKQL
jgi:aminoglycoside 6'-N-acetyltransferase I